jgi:hypothetical protein
VVDAIVDVSVSEPHQVDTAPVPATEQKNNATAPARTPIPAVYLVPNSKIFLKFLKKLKN